MCGEHLIVPEISLVVSGSSPHVRGARHFGVCGKPRVGIIPACAGSTCRASSPRRCARDHPRMCGEHGFHGVEHLQAAGSSPHVRGARVVKVRLLCAKGIIPACAGSTAPFTTTSVSTRDHPRMCGEHTYSNIEQSWIEGSSPHVRGAHVH